MFILIKILLINIFIIKIESLIQFISINSESSQYQQNESKNLIYFEHNLSGNYSNMILKDEFLYLTGIDYVFKLNSLEINKKDEIIYKERNLKPTNKNENDMKLSNKSHNYIKFLSARHLNNDLIVCGTNLGRPHIYDLKESDLTNQLEYNGDYLCTPLETYASLNLIVDSNTGKNGGLMYSAIRLTEELSNKYGIFSRYGLYRKEIEINKNFLRTLFNPYWLWEPAFISILNDSKYVFYFFTEISIEHFKFKHPMFDLTQLNNLSQMSLNNSNLFTRYARVARVCKNDRKTDKNNDVWKTFRKISLECNCNQALKSNETLLDFNDLKLIKQTNKSLFAIYYQTIYNLQTNEFISASVLCEYDFDLMKQKLENKNFMYSNDVDFDCDQLEDDNFTENLDFNNIENNTILNSNLRGKCQLVLPYKVTALEIESIQENSTLLFHMGTTDGKLLRLVKKHDFYRHLLTLQLQNSTIIEILLKNNHIYLSTTKRVYQLTSNICGNYLHCSECNHDPKCYWNQTSLNNCIELNDDLVKLKKQCSYRIQQIEVNLDNSLVLNCNAYSNTIEWFKNGIKMKRNDKNYVFTQSGDLVLINLNKSNLFSCQNLDVISYFNVTVLDNNLKLNDLFTDWMKKIEKFKFELNENINNCSF